MGTSEDEDLRHLPTISSKFQIKSNILYFKMLKL